MQGSCRPPTERLTDCIVFRSMLRCAAAILGVGFIASRTTSGIPVVMPPSTPPAWFVSVRMRPSRRINASFCPLPRSAAPAKPSPNSTPFTPGMANSAAASRLVTPSNRGSPSPPGSPSATHSITPPTESPAARAAQISLSISGISSLLHTGSGCAARASSRPASGQSGSGTSRTPPTASSRPATVIPRFFSRPSTRPPAAHSSSVMRPPSAPPPAGMRPLCRYWV